MSLSKTATALAVLLTFVGTAPAFAHKDGTGWLQMMESLRQQRAANAHAQELRVPPTAPQLKSKPELRYFGGPKGGLWPAR